MEKVIIMLVLLNMISEEDSNQPLYSGRAARRANRAKAINHNRRVYHDKVGRGIWFENKDADGVYRRHASGHEHHNEQTGRWATERLSGHRRFQKWSRGYHPSWVDEKHQRWDKIDSKVERIDEQIADAADDLLNAYDAWTKVWISDKADTLLNELYDELDKKYVNAHRTAYYESVLADKFLVEDNNHPGVIFYAKTREVAASFRTFLNSEGGDAFVWHGRSFSGEDADSNICDLDKEWDGSDYINPFYFWYYQE